MRSPCKICQLSTLCILNSYPKTCILEEGNAKEHLIYEFRDRMIKEITERRLRNATTSNEM